MAGHVGTATGMNGIRQLPLDGIELLSQAEDFNLWHKVG